MPIDVPVLAVSFLKRAQDPEPIKYVPSPVGPPLPPGEYPGPTVWTPTGYMNASPDIVADPGVPDYQRERISALAGRLRATPEIRLEADPGNDMPLGRTFGSAAVPPLVEWMYPGSTGSTGVAAPPIWLNAGMDPPMTRAELAAVIGHEMAHADPRNAALVTSPLAAAMKSGKEYNALPSEVHADLLGQILTRRESGVAPPEWEGNLQTPLARSVISTLDRVGPNAARQVLEGAFPQLPFKLQPEDVHPQLPPTIPSREVPEPGPIGVGHFNDLNLGRVLPTTPAVPATAQPSIPPMSRLQSYTGPGFDLDQRPTTPAPVPPPMEGTKTSALRAWRIEMPSLSLIKVAAMGAELADMPDEKIAGIMDVIRQNPEISGAVAGGGLGALAGGLTAEEEEDKRMRAVMGGLMGAAAGAGLGHLAGSPSSTPASKPAGVSPAPEQKVEGSPVAPVSPSSSSAGAVTPASEVESRLQGSAQRAQQQAEQAMTQQVVQDSAAHERAALLKDQGRVQARVQRLLAPQGPPSQNATMGGPRNLVLGPGVQRVGRFGMKAPSPSGGERKTAELPRMKAPIPRESMPETQRAEVQAPAGIVEVPS